MNMISMMYFKNFWNKWVNNNNTMLNIYYNMKLIFFPLYGLLTPIIVLICPYIIIKCVLKIKIPFNIYWSLIKKMYFSGGGIFTFLDKFFKIYQKTEDYRIQSGGSITIFHKITQLIIKVISFFRIVMYNIVDFVH